MLDRKTLAILEVLEEAGKPLGARVISQELASRGIELNERTVRYHLLHLDERGYTKLAGRSGRVITEKGRRELDGAMAVERLGFVNARIDELAWQSDFDLGTRKGKVVINITFFPREQEPRAIEAMRPVFQAGLSMSHLVIRAGAGERIGGIEVPTGMVGWGTVCSVTLNAVLLRHGIPVESSFGGLLEIQGGRPRRFVEIISYSGSTLDPIEIFIKGKMTSVHAAAESGEGRICASFRLIPASAHDRAAEIIEEMKKAGMGGLILLGKPGQACAEVPCPRDRASIVVAGGLNAPAAAEEMGVNTYLKAMASLVDYSMLVSFFRMRKRSAMTD
ncbi:MAG: NrpR regulatory domain-containing protein [Candidatus Geothermincolales bacterium]